MREREREEKKKDDKKEMWRKKRVKKILGYITRLLKESNKLEKLEIKSKRSIDNIVIWMYNDLYNFISNII